MRLFRIQNPDHFGGAWYNEDGSDNRIVDTLTDKTLAGLPMERDTKQYTACGKKWFCAAWSIEHLKRWFKIQDAEELIARGFRLASFDSDEYIMMDNQVNFTKEGVRNLTYFENYEEMEECEWKRTELLMTLI